MANDATRSKSYQLISAAFGLFFAIMAVAIVIVSDRSFWPLLVAAVIGIPRVEAVFSAFRNRPSLLSRIGPLP